MRLKRFEFNPGLFSVQGDGIPSGTFLAMQVHVNGPSLADVGALREKVIDNVLTKVNGVVDESKPRRLDFHEIRNWFDRENRWTFEEKETPDLRHAFPVAEWCRPCYWARANGDKVRVAVVARVCDLPGSPALSLRVRSELPGDTAWSDLSIYSIECVSDIERHIERLRAAWFAIN